MLRSAACFGESLIGCGQCQYRRIHHIQHHGVAAGVVVNRFYIAEAVGVTGFHPHILTGLGLRQRETAVRGGGDVCPIAVVAADLPLVRNRAHAVEVIQSVGGLQDGALRHIACDADAACGCVVHIGHTCCCGAVHGFCGSVQVGVSGAHMHVVADIGLGQGVAVCIGTADVYPVSAVGAVLPLVRNRAHAVCVSQCVGSLQDRALRHTACDGDAALVSVVDIGNGCGGGAGLAVVVTGCIGIADADPQEFTDLLVARRERCDVGTGNRLPRACG